MNLADLKRRRNRMLAINAAALAVAIVGFVGAFALGYGWLVAPAIAALVAGLAAQVWFIVGFARSGRAE